LRYPFGEVMLAFVTSNLFAALISISTMLRYTSIYMPSGMEWVYVSLEIGMRFLIGFVVAKLVANGIVKLFRREVDTGARNLFRIKKQPVE
jgi:hypothetical protein